ncbi:MAG: hypothetical protein AAF533_06020 [Acidobacteriota bacterium]
MSSRPLRAALVCPGRGSYLSPELGSLGRAREEGVTEVRTSLDAVVRELDTCRAKRGQPSVMTLDSAERFSPREHLRADHASALILAGSAADLGLVKAAAQAGLIEPVVACGNSLGWYTALHVSGALDAPNAARLVDTMASIQVERGEEGGQLVYPIADDDSWEVDATRSQAVEEGLAAARAAGGQAHVSIWLGGNVVLAGDEPALKVFTETLPPVERKGRTFPLRLAGHSAFHTPLMTEMSGIAQGRLGDLGWRAPEMPLIDGRGVTWSPFHADPAALRQYTLETQVLETYDFTTSVRVALREHAPDLLILLGPGDSLGGPVGQLLVAERWSGIASRADFLERQGSDDPIVASLGRAADRSRLLGLLEAGAKA